VAKEQIDIPDPYYHKRGIKDLLPLREAFLKYHEGATCTCDTCIDVTRCKLAYDLYNSSGDCLLSK
jgi:hypothetical protein